MTSYGPTHLDIESVREDSLAKSGRWTVLRHAVSLKEALGKCLHASAA